MIVNPEIVEIGEKIRAVFVPVKDFKTSQVTVSLVVPRGEYLAENIILPKYLVYSSKKYPSTIKLNSRLEQLYGTIVSGVVARRGETSRIELSATCIDKRFALNNEDLGEEVLALLLELLFNPDCENGSFNKEKVELQRRLSIESIESEINDKRLYALTRMTEYMCADEIYGIPRSEIIEGLKNTDEKKIYDAWKELLKTASVQINLIGGFDKEKSTKIIKDRFSCVEREPVSCDTLFVESADEVSEYSEEMEINQSKLVLGFRSGMTDRNDNVYAQQMFVDIFGGGPYSRLFMNVREKLSLCYYCSARLVREKGLVVIQSGIERQNKQMVLDEIKKQLEIMRNNEFDEADFKASKTAICDSLRGVFDTPDGIDSYLNTKFEEEIIPIEDVIKSYEAVTREDIVKMAKRLSLDTVYMLAGKENA